MVQNMMEQAVSDNLNKELAENAHKYTQLCQCPACIAVVQANALNHLKPIYVTGMAGQVFTEYRNKELQNYSDILVAIAKGVEETIINDPNGHMKPGAAAGAG